MRWANENPERYAEIAALPLSEQNAALRDAIGYDPDAIRDRAEEAQREHIHHHRDLSIPSAGGDVVPPRSAGSTPPAVDRCDCCGAPPDTPCAPTCEANRA